MEGLAHLVAESLVRHGFETTFDHRSLQWSQWFPCQDSFSLLLAPCKPGLFALGEELIAPGELAASDGKRMLALFHLSEAHDLGMAFGRLFLSPSPERERLVSGRCFARYVVIEDTAQRRSAHDALQRWMLSSADFRVAPEAPATRDTHVAPDAVVRGDERSSSGFVSGHDSENAGFVSKHNPNEAGFVSGHDFSRATNPATLTAALAAVSAEQADASEQPESSNKQAQIGPPSPIPSGF